MGKMIDFVIIFFLLKKNIFSEQSIFRIVFQGLLGQGYWLHLVYN